MDVPIPLVGGIAQPKVHIPSYKHALVRQQSTDGSAKRCHVERTGWGYDSAGHCSWYSRSMDHRDGKWVRYQRSHRRGQLLPLFLPEPLICATLSYDADIRGIQCEFIQWLESIFMTNASNSKITHYAYNENMGTLLNGASLTHSGSA